MPSLSIADGHVHELHLFELYKIMNHRLFCPCRSPIHFRYSYLGLNIYCTYLSLSPHHLLSLCTDVL